MSPAHFCPEFKKTFDKSPQVYLLTIRLERAATLLRSTNWPVYASTWTSSTSSGSACARAHCFNSTTS